SRSAHGTARFGEELRVGPVRLVVPALPPVSYAVLAIQQRDVTIDQAIQRLKVVPRPGTDVIDVRFVDSDPGRRRGFLGEQLRVTDSLLVVAEAGLSGFRSRQQMGSSRDNLSAEQASASALEAQETQLRADRRVFAALLERVRSTDPGAQETGFRALAYSPEVAADPV